MNSTGRQLSSVEQIKGKFFPAQATRFDACLNFEKKYAKLADKKQEINASSIADILDSTSIIENENDDKPSIGEKYRSVLTSEIFLLHSLAISLHLEGNDKDISHDKRIVLKTFVDTVGTNKSISPDMLLKCMEQYREWLDSNIIYLENLNGYYEYRFRGEENCSDEKREEMKAMRQFQSMLFVSYGDWQEWVLDAYFSNRQLTLDLLKEQDRKRHPFPDLSSLSYGTIDRYWFWKLDYILWEKAIEQVGDHSDKYSIFGLKMSKDTRNALIGYKFRRNRSIEHLHPQTDGLSEGNEWDTDNPQINVKPKDWFGNLAMISSGFNSAQSNDSIGVKFARLRDTQIPQKNLESIKMLLMFLMANGNDAGWNSKLAIKHGLEMCDILKTY